MINEIKNAPQEQYNRFLSYVKDVYGSLKPYQKYIDIDGVDKIAENFAKKTEDFYSDNRKFNIAVIGQVKAGKSSFLNTLLFKGDSLLPYAITPKTSTLTMIEYAAENSINVEFYDVYEWAELKKTARSNFDTPQARAARDILIMAHDSSVTVDECFAMQKQELKIEKLEEINAMLDSYVGECGSYTPYVKSVTLKVNLQEIKNITIVDTPGLNDPVTSRRIVTQEFIERCDAAFYLSRASYFLDSNDIALISTQLPQKGIKKLILIGSQYDNALLDIMRDGMSFIEAQYRLDPILTERAKDCIATICENLQKSGCSKEVVEVVRDCGTPYFISTVAENMAKLPRKKYNDLSNHIYSRLSIDGKITKQMLNNISGFKNVREVFSQLIAQKDDLLKNKENSFAVVANSELKHYLNNKKAELKSNIEAFEKGQLSDSKAEIKKLNDKINTVRQCVSDIFIECYENLEQSSFDNASRLFESRALIKPDIKTGIDVVNIGIAVSDKVWWNPFSWNKTHTEYVTRQKTYEYTQVKEVLDEIQFIERGATELYKNLCDELMAAENLKERLLKELMPTANANGVDLGSIMKQSLSKFAIAPLQLDFSEYEKKLLSRYEEKIVDEARSREMLNDSEITVKKLIDAITKQILYNLRLFASSTKNANNHICDTVLAKQYAELSDLTKQYESNQKSLRMQQEALEVISRYI